MMSSDPRLSFLKQDAIDSQAADILLTIKHCSAEYRDGSILSTASWSSWRRSVELGQVNVWRSRQKGRLQVNIGFIVLGLMSLSLTLALHKFSIAIINHDSYPKTTFV